MQDSPRLNPLLYGAMVAALGVLGYFMLFSAFAYYDDEGYILLTARDHFQHGGLYAGVYTQYGPAFYLLSDAIQSVFGLLGSSMARFFALVCWLFCCGSCGVAAMRSTRSLTLGGFAMVSSFLYLYFIPDEPFHPGLPIIAALGLIVMETGRVLLVPGKRSRFLSLLVGAVAGAVCLLKINVGILLCASLLCVMLSSKAGASKVWRVLLLVFPPLFSLLLMSPMLGQAWVLTFVLCFSAGTVALALTCKPFPADVFSLPLLGLGFAAAATCSLAYPLVRGASLQSLWEGVVMLPLKHPGIYSYAVDWRPGTLIVAACSLAFAISYAFSRGLVLARTLERVLVVLRLLQFILLCVGVVQLQRERVIGAVFSYAMALAWTWCVPLLEQKPTAAHLRHLIGTMLLFQMLHAYPVGGIQMAWGSFLLFPLVAIGLRETQIWASRVGLLSLKRSIRMAGLLALILSLGKGGFMLYERSFAYLENPPLGLLGSTGMRIAEPGSGLLRNLSLNAHVHGDLLFSLPGSFSLNLWSGVPAPSSANATLWYSMLSEDRQREIMAVLEKSPRACLVINEGMLTMLEANGQKPSGILYDYLRSAFVKAYQLEEYAFHVKKGRSIAPVGLATVTSAGQGRHRVVVSLLHDGRPLRTVEWERGRIDLSRVELALSDSRGLSFRPLSDTVQASAHSGFLRLSFEIGGEAPRRLRILSPDGAPVHDVLVGR